MSYMTTNDVRERYLQFFESKGHIRLPSASLLPENDATTLFTGSGMQPLLPYLLGQPHARGKRLTNSQKSFRAEDMDEVGDNRHTTFFEMLGNWSLGDYFKQEQLFWIFEFLIDEIKLDPKKIYVTVFAGNEQAGVPRDANTADIWQQLFATKAITATTAELLTISQAADIGMGTNRIFYYGSTKNWWSRSGSPANMPAGEPGGPDSEIFYDFGTEHDSTFGKHCHPNCDCGRFMEIGNSVFMEYIKQPDGSFAPLPHKNVDFGGGLERITAAANNNPDVFMIDSLQSIIKSITQAVLTRGETLDYNNPQHTAAFRVIADHLRAAVMLIADGALPSNTDQGYVTRRLLRRAARHYRQLRGSITDLGNYVPAVIEQYHEAYPTLPTQTPSITQAVLEELRRFEKTLDNGLEKFATLTHDTTEISAEDAFELYVTYGFPLDITLELARERGLTVDQAGFESKMNEHREKSRTASAGKFKGGLADHSEMSVKYHTATHLLHQALRTILGTHVEQRGSNITPERLRFDFIHPDKMTDAEKKQVEDLVNKQIQADLVVTRQEMSVAQAKEKGAMGLFTEKYGDNVTVYTIGDFSSEICGGPHVERTGSLGAFRIRKEESASAGIRRIKAVLE